MFKILKFLIYLPVAVLILAFCLYISGAFSYVIYELIKECLLSYFFNVFDFPNWLDLTLGIFTWLWITSSFCALYYVCEIKQD